MEHLAAFTAALIEASTILEFPLSDSHIQAFELYYRELSRWTEKINLTAITDPKDAAVKHFFDSLLAERLIHTQDATLLDVGTGAGFPGLVLKIHRPQLQVTLLEPNHKKVAFLHHIIGTLALSGVTVHAVTVQRFAETYAGLPYTHAITRAVRPVDLYGPLDRLLGDDGHLLLYRVQPAQTEEVGAPFFVEREFRYELPFGHGPRILISLARSKTRRSTLSNNDVPRGTSPQNTH